MVIGNHNLGSMWHSSTYCRKKGQACIYFNLIIEWCLNILSLSLSLFLSPCLEVIIWKNSNCNSSHCNTDETHEIRYYVDERNNKWGLLKLKSFSKQRMWLTRQHVSLQNGKISSPTPLQTEVWSPKYTKNSTNWISKVQIIQ